MNFEKFEPMLGSWASKLKPFIESEECDKIYDYLKQKSKEGRTICPLSSDTFRAFQETEYSKLKVIWFLQDPYPWIKKNKEGKNVFVADGVAMSCKNTGALQPSLELFYDAILTSMPEYNAGLKAKSYELSPDLSYLCFQGVMMINTALTTELNKPNAHSQISSNGRRIRLWEPFMKYFLEEVISQYNNGLVLIFSGSESQYYERYINPLQHYIFKVEHPAAAAHKEREWHHDNIFLKVNKILKENNDYTISWLQPVAPF